MKKVKIHIRYLIWFVLFMLATENYIGAEMLTLPDGIRQVTENSRLLRISRQDEAIADAEAMSSRSKMLPSLNASIAQTALAFQPAALFGPQQVHMSERNFLSYGLYVQQTLYDFMGTASKYEAGKTLLQAKKLDTMRIRNFAAIEFVLVYIDLLEAEKMLLVAEKEVERLESHLRDAENLYKEGVITRNDLLQAEVRISDARQKRLSAKSLRKITAARLNNTLSKPLNADVQVRELDDLPIAPVMSLDLEKAWEAALKDRVEIMVADETLKALGLETVSKKAEYYPRLFVRGGYDYTENKYQLHEGNWSLTIGMNINLFNGNNTSAELAKIEGQKQKLLQQREKLAEDIKLEVEKYTLESATARERLAVSSRTIQQAEENLRINKMKYEEGVGTATEVLDAVSLMTIAETNYYKSLYDLRKAEAAVLYAMGRQLAEVYK